MGEAAAALVLEGADAAQARGAHPLGHLLGCGLAPTPEAALQAALAQAGLKPDALCAVYINAAARDTASRLLPNLPVEEPARLCGDVQGATSALHLALALLARPAGPVLIFTVESGACVALVASLAVDADLKHAG
jgi:3-oxoacyl-(acyl-carrier-protein) synthase